MPWWSPATAAASRADTLVAYFARRRRAGRHAGRGTPPRAQPAAALPGQPPGTEASSIERVEAYGNVDIRTAEEVVRGDRGVYNPNSGMARLLGAVRITRGRQHS